MCVYGWAIKRWECRLLEERERERERDGPELAGQYITCYELVDFQRTLRTALKQENNNVRLGWDVEGCWAGRTRYLMIEEGL